MSVWAGVARVYVWIVGALVYVDQGCTCFRMFYTF